jgi:hypothetical protein
LRWAVNELPELKGFAVEWAEPGNYYLSRRNEIFHASDLTQPLNKAATVGVPFWRSAASRSRLAQRLLRFMVTNVIELEGGEIFVSFDKTAGIVSDGSFTPLSGMARPCRILRSAVAVDGSGDLYFGEYLANNERGEIRVYRREQGSSAVTIAHLFRPGTIRHIHGIYFDRFSGALFCLTGDAPDECRIIRTHDSFETLEVVGEGDETWRAVSLVFTEDAIYYGTDAEYRSNEIFRIRRDNGVRERLGEVNGTVFYSKVLGNSLVFATTAENAPAQRENVAALWIYDPDQGLIEAARFPKDRWHPTLFQFGTISFPYHNGFDERLHFQLVGVEGDNRSFVLERE